MPAPVCEFVEKYAAKGALRLHMPGHKGRNFTGAEERDITEIPGADVLYGANGVILESERRAAEIFGSGRTIYSCEGSSLCIRAMIYLAVLYAREREKGTGGAGGGKRAEIWAARNAHKAFFGAAALTGADVEYIGESDEVLCCNVSAEDLRKKLAEAARVGVLPAAVYITSPDYLGNTADVKGIAAACGEYGVLCLVDNAHGAYLKFVASDSHPMDCGADMCCDSAHKTLPVLTGGAYLHISKNSSAFSFLAENAERAAALFASTSPSYLILQSLDAANDVIGSAEYAERLRKFCAEAETTRRDLAEAGYGIAGNEPMKITLKTKPYGYAGGEAAEYLRQKGIECEFFDDDYVVFMFTPFLREDCFDVLKEALLSLPRREEIKRTPPKILPKKRATSIRDAVFSPSEVLPAGDCLGRIFAEENAACPPAVPMIACGEVIDENALELFAYYGKTTCRVVKED